MSSRFSKSVRNSAILLGWGLFGVCSLRVSIAENSDHAVLSGLQSSVEVVFDSFDIPHIYANTPEDAYRALGYLHAGERLWEMEMMRRRAAGTLAEVAGKDELESDILMRKLGIRKTSEEVMTSGLLGPETERAFAAYAEGVNAKIKELGAENLPSVFKALGLQPAPWVPADSIAFLKYMGWDQGGTDADLWFGMMVETLGVDAAEELWPEERPYEIATVPTWPPQKGEGESRKAEGEKASGDAVADSATINLKSQISDSSLIPHSSSLSSDVLALGEMASHRAGIGCAIYLELMARLKSAAANGTGIAVGSNNWVISGAKSTTGKPILCNDPHLGLQIPSVWYTAHLVAPGLNVIGITFPGCPFVIIGHNDRIAWGITDMQADAVDYFIETLNPDNPKQYKHKGEWKPLVERKETIKIRGAEPREIVIQSTAHGPIDKVGDKVIALAWTGLGLTADGRALGGINRARGLKDFVEGLKYLNLPALNMIYADVDGNIAIAPHGDLPIRARGKGRVPVDGASGDYDWIGYIPREKLPISVNPPRGYLASANGRPAPVGYPYYLGWMWDPSYRTRRINDLLASKEKISFEDMQAFQYDAHDKSAEVITPVLVAAYDRAPYGDATVKAAMELLRAWDCECAPEKSAPTIYAKWFDAYRSAVWDDEWKSRNIKQPEGSWGFTGDNKREPEIEVLEYLTRENPNSIWFDDRTTPERETRDDILKKSFMATIKELSEKNGPDPNGWKWGNVNKLRLNPIVPNPMAARAGMPVHGGPYTLNPGNSTGGPVTIGASWRQVVDLGDLGRSVGVYPGGQSENLKSPHYDDQVKLWLDGKYAPLWFHAKAADFKPETVSRHMTLGAK